MAFTVRDYQDLLHLLEQHPNWQRQLRELLLPDELLELPKIVRELAEAQRRTEDRLAQLTARVDELTARMDALAEAQRRTEERLDALAEAQKHTEMRLQKLTDTVADMRGSLLEIKYREKAYAYFGYHLKRVRVVSLQELEDQLLTQLSPDEFRELLSLDLLVEGEFRQFPQRHVLLALEVSAVIDRNDVLRAARRATLLRRGGFFALPVVAGERVTEGALEQVHSDGVIVCENGICAFWEEALAKLGPV
ncbi:MAG: hypothetical protein N2559_05595 [Anaerolineae bacterium]|nr:hypothetical protein [Anaerolineae bacterium]